MKRLNIFLLACLILLISPLSLSAKTLTIYHTSDTHGFFYPNEDTHIGGVAALASLIKQGPKNYLLLDSGDFANGAPEAYLSKGAKPVAVLNKLHYHATTIGDHEFDFKEKGLNKMLEDLTVPVLAANFVSKQTGTYPPHVQPYKIYEVDGTRVAVIGLANATPTGKVDSFQFLDPLKTLEKVLPKVETEKPSIVIVIVHDSIADDTHNVKNYTLDIAHRFPGRVHLVLGGHAHKTLSRMENGTLYVESGYGCEGASVIRVDLNDKTGQVQNIRSSYAKLDVTTVGESKEIKDFANALKENCHSIKLGKLSAALPKKSGTSLVLDSPISKWLTDLMRKKTRAQVAINNNGGMRKGLPSGKVITECDLLELYPFDNVIIDVEMKGSQLRKFVSSTLGLFSYSGLYIYFTQSKESNQKFATVIMVGNEPLNDEKTYHVAVPKFVAEGNMEAKFFADISADKKHQIHVVSLREMMRQELQHPTLDANNSTRNTPNIVDMKGIMNGMTPAFLL